MPVRLYRRLTNCRGKPTEETVKQCACMTMNHIIDKFGIPPERLILYLCLCHREE